MEYYNIRIVLKTDIFFIYLLRIRIKSNEAGKKRLLKFLEIKITAYQFWVARSNDGQSIKLFIIFLKDIKKALRIKKKTDSRQYLSKFY